MMWWECLQMVLLFVTVCWFWVNRYKPNKWTFFRILHQNKVQNIFQWNYNNSWKHMCIKILCYSTETYFRYCVQRGNPGQNIHVRSTSGIGPITKKQEFVFLCNRKWYRRGHIGLEPIISLVSNHSTVLTNTLLYHAEIFNNCLESCCIIVDGIWSANMVRDPAWIIVCHLCSYHF